MTGYKLAWLVQLTEWRFLKTLKTTYPVVQQPTGSQYLKEASAPHVCSSSTHNNKHMGEILARRIAKANRYKYAMEYYGNGNSWVNLEDTMSKQIIRQGMSIVKVFNIFSHWRNEN